MAVLGDASAQPTKAQIIQLMQGYARDMIEQKKRWEEVQGNLNLTLTDALLTTALGFSQADHDLFRALQGQIARIVNCYTNVPVTTDDAMFVAREVVGPLG